MNDLMKLTPIKIVAELNKYIIGQEKAKRAVAIALRNRWRRQQVQGELQDEIMPNNIILIGPTGVGKTEIARRLSRLANAPFVKVEASKFTEVGYVGRDVESMVRELLDVAMNEVRMEMSQQVKAKAKERAKEKVLDLLISPPKRNPKETELDDDFDEKMERYYRSRNKMQKKLDAGELDKREIEITLDQSKAPQLEFFSNIGMESIDFNFGEMISNILPMKKDNKSKKFTVPQALKALESMEESKLIDKEKVIKEAKNRVENSGIIFVDEIDKIASSSKDGRQEVSRAGVQRDLLPIVEGSNVPTKHGIINTSHILFIAAGAFHLTKPSDLIPELQGRFPIRVELNSLTSEDFIKILKYPKNALIKQYIALFDTEKVVLSFEDEAINSIADFAARANEKMEDIGARRLHTIMNTLLDSFLFEMPDNDYNSVNISKNDVEDRLGKIIKDEDLSRYIL